MTKLEMACLSAKDILERNMTLVFGYPTEDSDIIEEISAINAVKRAKKRYPELSDEQALDEFMLIHWAWIKE